MHKLALVALTAVIVLLTQLETHAYRWYYRYRRTNPVAARMHGMAHIIRNQGRATRAYSDAMVNSQEAQSKYLDNQKKFTATYFAKKEMHSNYTAQKQSKARAEVQSHLTNNTSSAPPKLNLSEFDPSTGKITWPDGLDSKDFATSRAKLESLFELRSQSVKTTAIAADIRKAVDDMKGELKTKIEKMTSQDYVACRKFLDSLAYTGTQPQ